MWKCPKDVEVMTLSEFQIYRDRLRNKNASSSTVSLASASSHLSRLDKIKKLFTFSEEEDWKVLENNYDFDVHSSDLSASSNDSSYKMTYTIETTNSFGISTDLILDLQWDEREKYDSDWKKMGHMYIRSSKNEGVAHKSFLLAEVSFVQLDKFDDTQCKIQFRPPHFLSHIEQFKFEEEEPYKIKFKNAADRTRFIEALK
jgi:hypothetical protein